ncbi:hypothetical protein KSS94_06750 [Pseudomonas fakonensis]|uniref:SMI1/KNR4 family protein n=1 Tax=Pseudomonas fakonensis TaxID=2842355 RepID=A0ABX8N981_9PSED|nr:hypothetical protein [Pseudomonas fakonensis]QXH52822.1 hypothetical protein KSS94_06750 [Pseudomonas fakonensis]
MLLSIAQIQQALQERFTPLLEEMPELEVYLLKRRSVSCPVTGLEQALNVQLPPAFVTFLSQFDMDSFTLGPITFGIGGDYLEHLLDLNREPNENPWWSTALRPAQQLVIATSDPYAIVLNCNDQHVYAITDTPAMEDSLPVAANFELFVQGIGTGFVLESDAEDIQSLVRSRHPDFWQQI